MNIMSQPWALPATLPSLSTKEAISDVVYRCVLSFDTQDSALFESSFTKDAVFDLNGKIMNGIGDIRTECFDSVSKLDTTHFINNVRIGYKEGESTATMTASALAQHYRTGQGMKAEATRLLAGSLYWLDLVTDESDGLWKAKHWRMKVIWAEGDWGVMTGNYKAAK